MEDFELAMEVIHPMTDLPYVYREDPIAYFAINLIFAI